ncbi:YbaK/EbsC family protein [Geosporobacter ferrireducens]|uniref:Prolyl-tRNA editing protein n=1 Tax=Geosporobacter ferrireducens TaxID=1424294 RepID=A0A1D8GJK7_9FIRM|nr:YbaK/EbsC family protein [Geosporobacter ferrireducens]AOT71012.1 prolyl-tRNA editing protein [Geosporobacter ferrireducens]MTI53731.1 YbaK/EbsC family protein [Geosporobacter ferrireducens]
MAVEDVRNFFIEKGLEDPIFELSTSSATVELASKSIGVEPGRIAKTLAFRLKDKDILIVAKGDSKIDNKKYKQYFKTKAKMLTHEEVEAVTGHPVGGLCPFGLKNPLEIFLDQSIQQFDTVYPAAGSRYAALQITPDEMLRLTAGAWIDVCE